MLGLIDSYRFFSQEGDVAPRDYEILPDGYFDLSFLLSESACRILLAGPYTQRTTVPLGDYELIIVHFKVGRLPGFSGVNPGELVDTMVELPGIDHLDRDAIGEWLLDRNTTAQKAELIENILGDLTLARTSHDTTYENAISLIDACDGRLPVGDMARILSVSTRTLERKFRQTLGIAPKRFAKLVRFQRVVEKIRSHASAGNLADVAYEFGYVDQAHFIRDFKSMSGRSPGSFYSHHQCVGGR